MTIYAYIRVSTNNMGQTTDNQRKLIEDAGFKVDEWVDETGVSGSIEALHRPAFKRMMQTIQAGDTIIVVAIDRLGRSAIDVLHTVDYFKNKSVKLRVLALDGVDLTSPTGRLLITMLSAVAEMEKRMLVERTLAGLARTKAQGTILGTRLTVNPNTIKEIVDKLNKGDTMLSLSLEYSLSIKTIGKYKREFANNPQALQEYEDKFYKQQEQINLKEK